MTKWIWIVRDGIGEHALIVGVGFTKMEALNHATRVWIKRRDKKTIPPEIRRGWEPLRVQIRV